MDCTIVAKNAVANAQVFPHSRVSPNHAISSRWKLGGETLESFGISNNINNKKKLKTITKKDEI